MAPDNAVAQLNAALAGRYEIEREIGAGGMATVYLARDVRHNRKVALKLLKPELGAVLGVERFLAEIQVTANLQHPNLLPLFDSGEVNGLLFYVMPFVEGESLRARLDREKQLPVDEAVGIAAAVASALDYAHRHDVIHRDLKPDNILLHEGQPLVADFGIALAVSRAGGNRITQTGLSLGTPQYMSPEQATGDRALDGRTDIYSLGAVLYEMLVGDPPHTGSTSQAIIAKVLTERPRRVRAGRPTVPAHVDASVDRALEKLAADRFATARDFSDAITGARAFASVVHGGRGEAAAPSTWTRRTRAIAPWLVAAAAAGWALSVPSRKAATLPTIRFLVPIAPASRPTTAGGLAVSENGAQFTWTGQTPNGFQLFVHSLNDVQTRPVAGTEGGSQPCFSPDGEWIAFFAGGKLRKASTAGGSPVTIANAETGGLAGCTWGAAGEIVFGDGRAGLFRVPASGGVARRFTKPDSASGERSHWEPQFLRDGKTLVFLSWRSGPEPAHLAFATLDGKVTISTQTGLQPQQLEDGTLLFASADGTLMAAPFDAHRLAVGAPVPLAENVSVRANGYAAWAVSPGGTLVIQRSEITMRLVLVARNGGFEPLTTEMRPFRGPRVSPDGGRIAVEVNRGLGNHPDIWVLNRSSRTLSRVTTDGLSSDPLWSLDGKRVLFTSQTESSSSPLAGIYWRNADGTGETERVVSAPGVQWAEAWTPDGRTLVYEEYRPGMHTHLGVIRLGDKDPMPILPSPSSLRVPVISPDGHWVAYASDESGRLEVYVAPYPSGNGKWQVSTEGGDEPVWAHSGRELFYRDLTSVIAATVRTSPEFGVTARHALFDDPYARSTTRNYDVMPDDQHFVMLRPSEESERFEVVANWLPELRARLGKQKNGQSLP
ncbi:MAG: protein kinase [Gemmatimonadales bacterium]